MNYDEFRNLPEFSPDKFKAGDSIMYWNSKKVIEPTRVQYFEGHPLPLVLWFEGLEDPLVCREKDIFRQIRMSPKDRYVVEQYITELNLNDPFTFNVVDSETKERIGEFHDKDHAEEYAKYLNIKDLRKFTPVGQYLLGS